MNHDRQMGFMWGLLAGVSACFAFIGGMWFELGITATAVYFCWSFGKRAA